MRCRGFDEQHLADTGLEQRGISTEHTSGTTPRHADCQFVTFRFVQPTGDRLNVIHPSGIDSPTDECMSPLDIVRGIGLGPGE